jgi:hypothetical protein
MSSKSRVDAMLAQFPGPVTLYPSRLKYSLLLLVSALFVAGGVAMVRSAAPAGWLVLIFFGLCAVFFVMLLLPGAAALLLDRDGFEMTSLFRRHRARWRDVSAFEVVAIHLKTMVVYNDKNLAGRALAKLSIAIAGRNAGLPDTYGLSGTALADLMTRWRECALSQPGKSV